MHACHYDYNDSLWLGDRNKPQDYFFLNTPAYIPNTPKRPLAVRSSQRIDALRCELRRRLRWEWPFSSKRSTACFPASVLWSHCFTKLDVPRTHYYGIMQPAYGPGFTHGLTQSGHLLSSPLQFGTPLCWQLLFVDLNLFERLESRPIISSPLQQGLGPTNTSEPFLSRLAEWKIRGVHDMFCLSTFS